MGSIKQINKICVLGTTGMLGSTLSQYFKIRSISVVEINRKEFDANAASISDISDKIMGVDFVVNCIGVIKPRIFSTKTEECLNINSKFPRNLAKLTKSLRIPCFHITTDCVYSGKSGNYNEDSYYDVEDLYGLSKLGGESSECMNLRTSIIGDEMYNKYSLIEWAKSQKGKSVSGFCNHYWNGVTTLYLSEIIEQIYLLDLYREGTVHIFSPESVSKYELLSMINNIYNLSLTIRKENALHPVDRTLSSKYNISKKLATKKLHTQLVELHEFVSYKR